MMGLPLCLFLSPPSTPLPRCRQPPAAVSPGVTFGAAGFSCAVRTTPHQFWARSAAKPPASFDTWEEYVMSAGQGPQWQALPPCPFLLTAPYSRSYPPQESALRGLTSCTKRQA